MFSMTSAGLGSRSRRANRFATDASLEPHPVGVSVLVVALVLVAVARGDTGLAHDDHAGGAAVDAQSAAGADVLVDHEDYVVVGVDAGLLGIGGFRHGVGRQHVDALPRADV